MRGMVTSKQLDQYWNLFSKHYSKSSSFIEYFKKQWLSEDSKTFRWHYFNCEPNVFMTNNICESLNSSIKRDWTNCEKQPLHLFLKTLRDVFFDVALAKVELKTTVEYPGDLKQRAAILSQKALFIFRNGRYYIEEKGTKKLTFAAIDKFMGATYTTLKEFKEGIEQICTLTWDQRKKIANCFCRSGFTYGVCFHKLALEMFLGSLSRPISLVKTQRRGRKKKASKALIKDEDGIFEEPPKKQTKRS